MLFIMGTYPDIQRRVVEELEEVFGDSGRAPEMADLANLKYLERCVKEALRLYPSVPFFERSLKTDEILDNNAVPGGTTISVNLFIIHRDPEFWPDPEKFDPDRFLPENMQNRHPYAYIPFSAGPRNCIGQKFALLEEKVVVSTVLRRFRVEAAQTLEDTKLQVAVVLRPKNGLHIRLFEREDKPKLRVADPV
ncbi:hypothetical protein B566_EDAN009301 [Ephemera danica]|nr:hypothetical protein B566_EDAN009301 [Ephemera danica]